MAETEPEKIVTPAAFQPVLYPLPLAASGALFDFILVSSSCGHIQLHDPRLQMFTCKRGDSIRGSKSDGTRVVYAFDKHENG